MRFETTAQVTKVDDSLGLVFGWAIICNEGGQPYFDLQNDHIPEDAMLKAATDFMQTGRMATEMHDQSEERGTIVYAFPMTAEIAKAFGIQTERTGLMIAMRPDSAMMAKFKSGELTGFSIGGKRLKDEHVA